MGTSRFCLSPLLLLMTWSFIVVWIHMDNIPRIFTALLDFHWPNARILKTFASGAVFFFFLLFSFSFGIIYWGSAIKILGRHLPVDQLCREKNFREQLYCLTIIFTNTFLDFYFPTFCGLNGLALRHHGHPKKMEDHTTQSQNSMDIRFSFFSFFCGLADDPSRCTQSKLELWLPTTGLLISPSLSGSCHVTLVSGIPM